MCGICTRYHSVALIGVIAHTVISDAFVLPGWAAMISLRYQMNLGGCMVFLDLIMIRDGIEK